MLELLNRIVRHDIRNDVQSLTGWGEVLKGRCRSRERRPSNT
ncbi:MAG: hypothetical protein MAG715_00618 [Methanonatronarchaeales archaeon]|nr:hypothetical protein [Methanonatronarchaeales archaeon]